MTNQSYKRQNSHQLSLWRFSDENQNEQQQQQSANHTHTHTHTHTHRVQTMEKYRVASPSSLTLEPTNCDSSRAEKLNVDYVEIWRRFVSQRTILLKEVWLSLELFTVIPCVRENMSRKPLPFLCFGKLRCFTLGQSECTENNRNILKITSVEPTNYDSSRAKKLTSGWCRDLKVFCVSVDDSTKGGLTQFWTFYRDSLRARKHF